MAKLALVSYLKAEFQRLPRALNHVFDGLRNTLKTESAFRIEVLLAVILIPWAFTFRIPPAQKMILVGAVLLVLVVELLNTAIESTVDRISEEHHPLAKKAKDAASAAVFVALALAALMWWMVLSR